MVPVGLKHSLERGRVQSGSRRQPRSSVTVVGLGVVLIRGAGRGDRHSLVGIVGVGNRVVIGKPIVETGDPLVSAGHGAGARCSVYPFGVV